MRGSHAPGWWLLCAASLSLAACDGKKRKGSSGARPTDAAAPTQTVDPATVGQIAGEVRVTGKLPPRTTLEMSEAACKKMHDKEVYVDRTVAKDGKLQSSFVYIRSGLEAYAFPTPKTEVVLDQKGCIYHPRIVGVQVDQPFTFVNSDSLMHNIHTLPQQNDGANFAMPARGMRRTKRFDVPEIMVKTQCDVHPWMLAYIGVVSHPHFAVTGADGAFVFKGVPPGKYTVEAWHEVLGRQHRELTLKAKGAEKIEFVFAAK